MGLFTKPKREHYVPYEDIDPEIRAVIRAMNDLPGICTYSSCIGHGNEDGYVCFCADSQKDLYRFLKSLPFLHDKGMIGKRGEVIWKMSITIEVHDHYGFIAPQPSGPYYEVGNVPLYYLTLSCTPPSKKPKLIAEIERALANAQPEDTKGG